MPVLLALAVGCGKPEDEDDAGLQKPYSMADLLSEATTIAEGALEAADPATATARLRIRSTLKGKLVETSIPLRIESSLHSHQPILLRHLKPGTPVVLFTADNQASCLLYWNRFFLWGIWDADQGGTRLEVSIVERRLSRTFTGSAAELVEELREVLAGRRPPVPYAPDQPFITAQSLRDLPAWGEPVDEEYLPRPFRR